MPANAYSTRPVTLTREGPVFRLAFAYNPQLVEQVKTLWYADWDGISRTWTVRVCEQNLQLLRRMWHAGSLDVPPDDLVHPTETISPAAPAELTAGTAKRPYVVRLGDSSLFPAFRALPGSQWEKRISAMSYSPAAAGALAEMIERGKLADHDGILTRDGVVVSFDGRTGTFRVSGDDRAANVFAEKFPATDVIAAWQEKELPVSFLDDHTALMYRAARAKIGEGIQPDGMKIDLMPHQRQTVELSLILPGTGVFDEPGLGKTAEAIASGYEMLRRDIVTRVVVVVPAAVRTQWGREITKFTPTDESDIVVVRGDKDARYAAYEAAANAKWLIVHYDVLSRDKDQLAPLFVGAFVVADEAHRLKSYKAARTKAMESLARRSTRRMALTGTPVETHPGEWFQILSGFAYPGCLGSPRDFNESYRWPGRHGGYEGARNVNELRERSRPYYVRRTKAQVAKHLPPLMVKTEILDPSPAYEAALRRAHGLAKEELKAAAKDRFGFPDHFDLLPEDMRRELEAEATAGAEMTAVGQLRLLCSSPRLISEESAAGRVLIESGLVPDEDGPKVDEIRTLCAELDAAQQQRHAAAAAAQAAGQDVPAPTAADVTGERIVLFTFSKRMADLLHERLTEDGVKHVMFTGDTSADDRDAAVAAFTDPTSDVIAFVATDAAAEGLNLGTCCSTLINIDLPWTPARLAQRSQRIHRLDGKAAHYQVTNFIVGGTMEFGILKLLEARSDLADSIFGETGGRNSSVGRTAGGRRPVGKPAGRGTSLAYEALASYEVDDATAKALKAGRTNKATTDAGAEKASTRTTATKKVTARKVSAPEPAGVTEAPDAELALFPAEMAAAGAPTRPAASAGASRTARATTTVTATTPAHAGVSPPTTRTQPTVPHLGRPRAGTRSAPPAPACRHGRTRGSTCRSLRTSTSPSRGDEPAAVRSHDGAQGLFPARRCCTRPVCAIG